MNFDLTNNSQSSYVYDNLNSGCFVWYLTLTNQVGAATAISVQFSVDNNTFTSTSATYTDSAAATGTLPLTITAISSKALYFQDYGRFVKVKLTTSATGSAVRGTLKGYYNLARALSSGGGGGSTTVTAGTGISVSGSAGGPYVVSINPAETPQLGANNIFTGTIDLTAGALKGVDKTCQIIIGDPDSGSPVLVNGNDQPQSCVNNTGQTLTITGVNCYSDAGSPTVTPIISGGGATTILTGALTCSQTSGGAVGTLNGTPTQTNGQLIDGNITTAGGTARYIVMTIKRIY